MNKIKYIVFSFLLTFVLNTVLAQENINEIHTIKKNGLSLGFLGTTPFLGISYDRMISKKILIEMGLGNRGMGACVKYYLTNKNLHRLNYYVGSSLMGIYNYGIVYYLPLGISYFSKKNFYHSFETGVTGSFGDYPTIYFGLKTGYRFGKDYKPLKMVKSSEYKNVISWSLGGNTFILGCVYERFLNSFLSCEAGIGLPISAGVGFKFYIPRNSEGILNCHIGSSFFINYWASKLYKIYFPIGVNILSIKRHKFSIDTGPKIDFGPDLLDDNDDLHFTINIRYGHVF